MILQYIFGPHAFAMTDDGQPLLTLEPIIEAIQDGITRSGWVLSGLQKTTSHQFRRSLGRGELTQRPTFFFHDDKGPDFVSIDVFPGRDDEGP